MTFRHFDHSFGAGKTITYAKHNKSVFATCAYRVASDFCSCTDTSIPIFVGEMRTGDVLLLPYKPNKIAAKNRHLLRLTIEKGDCEIMSSRFYMR